MQVAERVKKHREKLREKGLRPRQIWVPDTRLPEFIAKCKAQSKMLKDDPQEKEVLTWIEEGVELSGWE